MNIRSCKKLEVRTVKIGIHNVLFVHGVCVDVFKSNNIISSNYKCKFPSSLCNIFIFFPPTIPSFTNTSKLHDWINLDFDSFPTQTLWEHFNYWSCSSKQFLDWIRTGMNWYTLQLIFTAYKGNSPCDLQIFHLFKSYCYLAMPSSNIQLLPHLFMCLDTQDTVGIHALLIRCWLTQTGPNQCF